MQPAVTQLIDIYGLDPASWWPPAPGWWLVAALFVLGLAALPRLLPLLAKARKKRRPRWQRDAQRRLHNLRRRAASQEGKETASELSELLRRIAMARFGRAACAGLSGQGWLDWLHEKDPTGFDWQSNGRPLLELPYAPDGYLGDTERLQQLIDAALLWTVASEEPSNV